MDDPDVFEKEFMKYLKEQGYEIDDTIMEEVVGFGEVLFKGEYTLVNDILNKEEEELTAKAESKVATFKDEFTCGYNSWSRDFPCGSYENKGRDIR